MPLIIMRSGLIGLSTRTLRSVAPSSTWAASYLRPSSAAFITIIAESDFRYRQVAVRHRLRSMGIRDKPIAPGSPWQNGFAERLIGSIRRECVDYVIALGEAHLRRILQAYARYYNDLRTHRSLNEDAPLTRRVQRSGHIVSHCHG